MSVTEYEATSVRDVAEVPHITDRHCRHLQDVSTTVRIMHLIQYDWLSC
jgi:hypothetical protein